ncbi:MAG: terminase [Bacteroidales bacterium]|nr:terminase [Bacteroidales bacterium]
MTKKESEQKKELARLYYMQGESQKTIAEKVGVSAATINKWVETGSWKEKKAGQNVTRPEIVNKNLVLISRLLDRLNSEDIDLKDVGKIVDQVSKLAAAIERIDKKANVIDAIEVFTALNRWLEARMEWDGDITPELLAQIERYQDLYISEQVKK